MADWAVMDGNTFIRLADGTPGGEPGEPNSNLLIEVLDNDMTNPNVEGTRREVCFIQKVFSGQSLWKPGQGGCPFSLRSRIKWNINPKQVNSKNEKVYRSRAQVICQLTGNNAIDQPPRVGETWQGFIFWMPPTQGPVNEGGTGGICGDFHTAGEGAIPPGYSSAMPVSLKIEADNNLLSGFYHWELVVTNAETGAGRVITTRVLQGPQATMQPGKHSVLLFHFKSTQATSTTTVYSPTSTGIVKIFEESVPAYFKGLDHLYIKFGQYFAWTENRPPADEHEIYISAILQAKAGPSAELNTPEKAMNKLTAGGGGVVTPPGPTIRNVPGGTVRDISTVAGRRIVSWADGVNVGTTYGGLKENNDTHGASTVITNPDSATLAGFPKIIRSRVTGPSVDDQERAQVYSYMFEDIALDQMVNNGDAVWYGATVIFPVLYPGHNFIISETHAQSDTPNGACELKVEDRILKFITSTTPDGSNTVKTNLVNPIVANTPYHVYVKIKPSSNASVGRYEVYVNGSRPIDKTMVTWYAPTAPQRMFWLWGIYQHGFTPSNLSPVDVRFRAIVQAEGGAPAAEVLAALTPSGVIEEPPNNPPVTPQSDKTQSPPAYSGSVTVILTSSADCERIRYTLNGTDPKDPTPVSARVIAEGNRAVITIANVGTTNLWADAVKGETDTFVASTTAKLRYDITTPPNLPDPPIITPAAGAQAGLTRVTITAIPGEVILYTTDNTDPASSGTAITSTTNVVTFDLIVTTTVKAYAQGGSGRSTLATSVFTLPEAPPIPTITPSTGTTAAYAYTTSQLITLASAGSTGIRYTLDGIGPKDNPNPITYTGPFTITGSPTIKADAHINGIFSGARTATYAQNATPINPDPPTASPTGTPAAPYTFTVASIDVALAAAAGVTIRYTTNGSDPRASLTAATYSLPINVTGDFTITAVSRTGTSPNFLYSTDVQFAYKRLNAPATPIATPGTSGFSTPIQVSLSSDPGAVIKYTTIDGESPLVSGITYTGPITISVAKTLRAVATANGLNSPIGQWTYTALPPLPAAPTVSPAAGTYTGPITITVSVPSGATVRYTRNGDDPITGATALEVGPFGTGQGLKLRLSISTTVRAKSRNANGFSTAELSAAYTLPVPTNPPGNPPAPIYDDFLEGADVTLDQHTLVAAPAGVIWINYPVNGALVSMTINAGTGKAHPDGANSSYGVNVGSVNMKAEVSYTPRSLAANRGGVDVGFDASTKNRYAARIRADNGTVSLERYINDTLDKTWPVYTIGGTADLLNSHRLSLERTVPDATFVRLVVKRDDLTIFDVQDSDANRITLGTRARITHYGYAAPGGAFTSFMAGPVIVAGSGTPTIQVKRGDLTIPAAPPGTATVNIGAVNDLAKAFTLSSSNTGCGGGPSTDQTGIITLKDVTSRISLTAADTVTGGRDLNATGPQVLAQAHPFEVPYYTGAVGGPNEWTVLGRVLIVLADGQLTAKSGALLPPSNSARVWINWTQATERSDQRFDRARATCQLINDAGTWKVEATRGDGVGNLEVQAAAIEMNGVNWGVSPFSRQMTTAGSIEYVTGLASANIAQSMVYTGQRMVGTNTHFSDISSHLAWPSDATSIALQLANTVDTPAGVTIVGWRITNPTWNWRRLAGNIPATTNRAAPLHIPLDPALSSLSGSMSVLHAYTEQTSAVGAEPPCSFFSGHLLVGEYELIRSWARNPGKYSIQVGEMQQAAIAVPLIDAGVLLELVEGGTYTVPGRNFQNQGTSSRLYISPTSEFNIATAVSQEITAWVENVVTFKFSPGNITSTVAYLFVLSQSGLQSTALEVLINALPPSAGNVRGFEALQVTLTVEHKKEVIENLNPADLRDPATGLAYPVGKFRVLPRKEIFSRIDEVNVVPRGGVADVTQIVQYKVIDKNPELGCLIYLWVNNVLANYPIDVIFEGS